MNNELNNPVDNVVTNMVSDDINTIVDNDNHSQLVEVDIDAIHTDTNTIETIETDMEKVGKGRPPHLPNADTRNRVFILSTVGTRHEDIATVLNISHDTLVKYYKEELDKGRIEANASVAETLFKQAKEGNTTAMIFWLKSRAKWKETSQHEISGNPDGTPVEVKIITGIE
jgi:phosphohistidine phosphatase SixA